MNETVTPNKCRRCPTCRRPLLYHDQCLDCGWEFRPDFWDERADVVIERAPVARDRDEGWPEGASTWARRQDDDRMAELSS